jgi:RNA polymerase sigma factor (sigma-70 family)
MTGVAELVQRATSGDERAWAALVEEYGGLLRSIAAGYRLSAGDAEDAAQTTWLGLVQHVGELRTPEAAVGWLATTMRRNCLRLLRQRRRELLRDDWTQWSLPDESVALDRGVLTAERDRVLWAAVDRLPQRQRQLVQNLFASREQSYGEIAVSMSTAVGSIGPARQRALRQLAALLGEAGVSRGDQLCA